MFSTSCEDMQPLNESVASMYFMYLLFYDGAKIRKLFDKENVIIEVVQKAIILSVFLKNVVNNYFFFFMNKVYKDIRSVNYIV